MIVFPSHLGYCPKSLFAPTTLTGRAWHLHRSAPHPGSGGVPRPPHRLLCQVGDRRLRRGRPISQRHRSFPRLGLPGLGSCRTRNTRWADAGSRRGRRRRVGPRAPAHGAGAHHARVGGRRGRGWPTVPEQSGSGERGGTAVRRVPLSKALRGARGQASAGGVPEEARAKSCCAGKLSQNRVVAGRCGGRWRRAGGRGLASTSRFAEQQIYGLWAGGVGPGL